MWTILASHSACSRFSFSNLSCSLPPAPVASTSLSPDATLPIFLQSHPFVVMPWSEEEQSSLDFLIEPHRGLTRELLFQSEIDLKSGKGVLPRLVLFSGPHEISAPVGEYEIVPMVASGFGIVAYLSYLSQLLCRYKARKSLTR